MNDFDKEILCRDIMKGTALLTNEQVDLINSKIVNRYYSQTTYSKIAKATLKYFKNPQDKIYAMLLVKEIRKRL